MAPPNYDFPPNFAHAATRLRHALGISQRDVASKADIDQSRISRVEKGEPTNDAEMTRILDALATLGSNDAARYAAFLGSTWTHLDRPDFWNPDSTSIRLAEGTLAKTEAFLRNTDISWPLARQLERQTDLLAAAARYLIDVSHNIAFVGEIGVGKSTALSFLYDLLLVSKPDAKLTDRVMLEAGAGGTTVCEVCVRRGPDFGIVVQPITDNELRQLVADLSVTKWTQSADDAPPSNESVGVGREFERAIRNMAGLTTRRETGPDGKRSRRDLLAELVSRCESEDELRTKILDAMELPARTAREIWFDTANAADPLAWLADTFKAINNGRHRAFSLPRGIDLILPEFQASKAGLETTVIDTKGVDDLAVREDIDARLRDPRTAVVLCTRFNDAPSQAVRTLLQHMRRTFPEQLATRKLSILVLPRTGEATSMKDDAGEFADDDADGYELKQDQIDRTISGPDDDLQGVPIHFLNVDLDEPARIRAAVNKQVTRMREAHAGRIRDLCATVNDLIENHELESVTAAIEEVANQLRAFLQSNPDLGPKQRDAHHEALSTVDKVRYAATLWASARRNGQYSGLSIGHQTGIGAAHDGLLRSHTWFTGVQMRLEEMKANPGLQPATSTITQIEHSVLASKSAFADALQTAGVEVYREPLLHANELWSACAAEWGRGPGFKQRVRNHLDNWFQQRLDLRQKLEALTHVLWDEKVVRPVLSLVDEHASGNAEPPCSE